MIIPQADLRSGSMQSAKYALSLQKKVFVPPHHIGQSNGTQSLAKEGKAEVIWDIEEWMERYFVKNRDSITQDSLCQDEILEFCKKNPLFEEAFLRFGEILFEYELDGKITRNSGRIVVSES